MSADLDSNATRSFDDALVRVRTVITALETDPDEHICTVLIDECHDDRTLIAEDAEAQQLLERLEKRMHKVGYALEAAGPTASTVATLAEAYTTTPREERITVRQPAGDRYRLPRPTETLSVPLGQVLALRRSVRRFGVLQLQQLSTVLFHSTRVRDSWRGPADYPATSRAAPSAGARHPIDLILIPGEPSTLEPRMPASAAYFDPHTCELVALPPDDAARFGGTPDRAAALIGVVPPITLVLAADLRRTFSRYHGGLSLVYRDGGALTSVLMIVAAAIGLACCPLDGTLDSPPRLSDVSDGWVDVGGLALGGPSPP